MKYRIKPIVVDAEQWDPDSLIEQPAPHEPDRLGVIWHYGPRGQVCNGFIETLEGGHTVSIGDWIITGIKGEKYSCKPDIFEATYGKEKDDVFEIRIPNLRPDEVEIARAEVANATKDILNKLQARRSQRN